MHFPFVLASDTLWPNCVFKVTRAKSPISAKVTLHRLAQLPLLCMDAGLFPDSHQLPELATVSFQSKSCTFTTRWSQDETTAFFYFEGKKSLFSVCFSSFITDLGLVHESQSVTETIL